MVVVTMFEVLMHFEIRETYHLYMTCIRTFHTNTLLYGSMFLMHSTQITMHTCINDWCFLQSFSANEGLHMK